jgi:hypothetical protein
MVDLLFLGILSILFILSLGLIAFFDSLSRSEE